MPSKSMNDQQETVEKKAIEMIDLPEGDFVLDQIGADDGVIRARFRKSGKTYEYTRNSYVDGL